MGRENHPAAVPAASQPALPRQDFLARAICETHGIRVAVADVSGVALAIARDHLAGPVATAALAEALVATALLSVHIKEDDEAIAFQLDTDGPLRGLTAEIWDRTALRGFTRQKLLDDLDDRGVAAVPEALGHRGTLTVFRTRPGKLLSSGTVALDRGVAVSQALARYLNHSLQTPAGVAIRVTGPEEALAARGVLVEKLPGGDTPAFVTALERITGPAITTTLGGVLASDDVAAVGAALGLPGLRLLATEILTKRCRCSPEKVLDAFAALGVEDLREIVATRAAQTVHCHFCGRAHVVPAAAIQALLMPQ